MTSRLIKQSLVSASIITIVAGLLSRPVGFLREAVIADYFGTSALFDTFVLALTVPELLAAIIFAAVPTALIPSLQDSEFRSLENRHRLFWRGLGMLTAVLAGLAIVVYLARSEIFGLLAPLASPTAHQLGCDLLALLPPIILFRGLEAYFRGWLHHSKHFLGPSLSPFLLNAVLLGSVILLYNSIDIKALAVGWLVGTALLLVYNALLVGDVIKPVGGSGADVNLSPLFKLVLSVAIIEMISLAYPIVDRALAARLLGEGQIAALRYAFYLAQLPTGLLVVTFSLASFPWIADLSSGSDSPDLRRLYRRSVGLIAFVMLPVVIGMLLYAPELVRTAFQRGEFDLDSTHLTLPPFLAYTAGLLLYSVYIYQMRYYLARKLMLRLGSILVVMLIVKVAASLALVGPLGHTGLAWATTIAWTAGMFLMSVDLARVHSLTLDLQKGIGLTKPVVAAGAAAGVWLVLRYVWPATGMTTLETGLWLAAQGAAGVVVYFALASWLKMEQPLTMLATVRKALTRRESNR